MWIIRHVRRRVQRSFCFCLKSRQRGGHASAPLKLTWRSKHQRRSLKTAQKQAEDASSSFCTVGRMCKLGLLWLFKQGEIKLERTEWREKEPQGTISTPTVWLGKSIWVFLSQSSCMESCLSRLASMWPQIADYWPREFEQQNAGRQTHRARE